MTLVFISYAREDEAHAKLVYDTLTSQNIECWMDTENLLPGQRWRAEIRKAIRECTYFIILLSQRSLNKRGFVQAELQEALRVLEEAPTDEVFLIPVRIDDCAVQNEVLRELTWVDLFPNADAGLSRLVRGVQGGQKTSIGATNRMLGGLLPAPKRWTEADFVETVWREDIEDGYPETVWIHFKANGQFLWKDNFIPPDDFRATTDSSRWEVTGSRLVLHWNNEYNLDTFELPNTDSQILYGVQSVGYKRISFHLESDQRRPSS